MPNAGHGPLGTWPPHILSHLLTTTPPLNKTPVSSARWSLNKRHPHLRAAAVAMPSALMLFSTPLGFYTSHSSLLTRSEALLDLSTLYPPSCFIFLPMTSYHLTQQTHFSNQLERNPHGQTFLLLTASVPRTAQGLRRSVNVLNEQLTMTAGSLSGRYCAK